MITDQRCNLKPWDRGGGAAGRSAG